MAQGDATAAITIPSEPRRNAWSFSMPPAAAVIREWAASSSAIAQVMYAD